LRPHIDPGTDPGGDPHEPPIKPPRGDGAGGAGAGNGGGRGSPPSTVPGTVSETGNPIPIVYGTVRLGLQVLERYPYSVGSQTNVWLANHAYNVGDVVIANGNVYVCTAQGTSFPSTYTLASATIVNGGNGYAVNDTIDLALGVMTTRAQLKVTGQSAGHITAISVNAAGVGYTRLPPSPDGQDSTSGGGSGATFSLVWNPGGGPFGQGDNITGGNGSLRWKFLYPATVAAAQAAQWVPSTAYAVGAVVGSVGNLYYCFTAGTSSASGSLGNGPSGQSTDITDGTVHWSYIQPGYVIPCVFGICEGQIYGVSGAWQDNFAELPSITSLPHPGTQIQLDLGTSGGWTRPAWIPTPDPTLADLYPNTALLSMVFLSNGGDGSLPNLSLEVAGIFCDATHADVCGGHRDRHPHAQPTRRRLAVRARGLGEHGCGGELVADLLHGLRAESVLPPGQPDRPAADPRQPAARDEHGRGMDESRGRPRGNAQVRSALRYGADRERSHLHPARTRQRAGPVRHRATRSR
jgi:chitodextrinase